MFPDLVEHEQFGFMVRWRRSSRLGFPVRLRWDTPTRLYRQPYSQVRLQELSDIQRILLLNV